MDKIFEQIGTINYKKSKYANVFIIGSFVFLLLWEQLLLV